MAECAKLPDVVRTLRRRLIALHCSDYDGVNAPHCPPFRGAIDWAAFQAALRDVAFLEDNYARLVAVGCS